MADYLGYTTAHGDDWYGAQDIQESSVCVAPVSGTLTDLTVEFHSGTATGVNCRIGVYADNGSNQPGALLLDAGVIVSAVGEVTKTGLSLAITNGTTYWLCILCAAQTDIATSGDITNGSAFSEQAYGALPDPHSLTSIGYHAYKFRMFGTLAAAAAATNVVQNIV